MDLTIKKALQIAIDGNLAKEAIRFLGKRKRMKFLSMLRNGEIKPGLDYECPDGKIRIISKRRAMQILAVDTVEMYLLQEVEALLKNRTRRFLEQLLIADGDYGQSFDDAMQELRMTVSRVIHMYDALPTRKAYLTVLKGSIRNQLNRWASKQNLLAIPEEGEAADLRRVYEETIRKHNGPYNFDEIATLMGVEGERLDLLQSALSKVLPISSLNDEGIFEETSDAFETEHVSDNSYSVATHVSDAVKRAALSPFEKILVEEFSRDGDTGWQKRVAEKLYRVVEIDRPKSVAKATDPAFLDQDGEQQYGEDWTAMKDGTHAALHARVFTKQAVSSAFERALSKVKEQICVA